jgi:hypothetical protein
MGSPLKIKKFNFKEKSTNLGHKPITSSTKQVMQRDGLDLATTKTTNVKFSFINSFTFHDYEKTYVI